ncbi:2607_t:CDS:1 [Funneliformis geosporum]|uniref:13178_t:CDS:1 n=1 Tax=Funneliformis geosporum TaxID=1117311 RepID=A0A9W4WQ82_9GLOM|nr:2607_t:CDS:1 [Funneliformis geosporum]CAI2163894.1 13178_t:CDS:1 [Funneliformis geosporum]
MSPPLSPKKHPLTRVAITQSNDDDELNNKSLEKPGLNEQQLQEPPQQQQPNLETTPKIAFIQEVSTSTMPRKKYRMRLFEAPPELLEFIKTSEEEKNKATISPNNKRTAATDIVGGTNDRNGSSFATPSSHNKGRMIMTPKTTTGQQTTTRKIISDKRSNRSRKNPYPKKAPSKSSPGITLKVDVFTAFKEDPASLLKSDDPPTNSNSMSLLFSEFSSSESSPPQSPSPQRSLSKKQRKQHKTKTKRSKNHISERKRKGNSLARVMADRGLIETTFNPVTTVAGEIKQIRIPPPPPMLFDELVKSIDQLGLTTELLSKINPRINWKGQPLSISHLPHYNSLHPKEAIVASTLRLTPVQYLTAKNTLVSSARRYIQKSLPFRKSDAQKLLRIDVNKASKLWEFFMQVKWI